MTNLNLNNLLLNAEIIAREAGGEVMTYYKKETTKVSIKVDGSYVTDADVAAETVILGRLRSLTPDIPIVSEEAAERGVRPDIGKGTFWVVDPIDGTEGFKNGTGNFVVAIALVIDGKVALGVVYDPVANTLYSGAGSGSASKIGADGIRTPMNAVTSGENMRILVNDLSANVEEAQSYLENQFNTASFDADRRATNLRAMTVAEGHADMTLIYPKRREGRTKWWDIAPAHAIVEAAGGKVEDTNGNPLTYDAADYQVPQHVMKGAKSLQPKK